MRGIYHFSVASRRATPSRWAAGISTVAICAAFLTTSAQAQTQADEEEAPDAIIVTGIRQSLASSQRIKKDSDTIVDAITSEDIGALPDRSVTEALQRVPGVSINRFAGSNDPDHFSVEGSGVVIRGLNFVRSEFNGRTAFAAGVGGQALNFADVPSELLGSVIISKNSTADMIEGGLAGTVNLNTRKPLDRKGFNMSFSAEANYGDFAKKWTPTISGLISKTWETDKGTFGLLVSGAFSRIKSRADGAQIANYQVRDGAFVNLANTTGVLICRNPLPGSADTRTLPPGNAACGALGAAGADGKADYSTGFVAPVGGQFRTQEFDRKRDGFSVAAQFESVDRKTQLTLEYIRSHTTNSWGEYTFETAPDQAEYTTYPRGCLQNSDGPQTSAGVDTSRADCPVGFTNFNYDANGLFQSGYIVNTSNGWRGATNTDDATAGSPFVPVGGVQTTLARRQVEDETLNQEFSVNLKTALTDRLTVTLDGHYAKSHKQNLDFSVFGSSFIDQELDLSGDLPVITPHKPTYLGYTWSSPSTQLGSATEAQYFSDPRFQFWRAAMDHVEDSTGEQFSFRADAEYDLGEDSFIRKLKFGARYQDRDQTVRYTTYNWGMLSEVWSGNRPVNFADTPANLSSRYDFNNYFRGQIPAPPGAFYYSGDLIKNYDQAVADFQSIQARAVALGGAPTWTPLVTRPRTALGQHLVGTSFILPDIQPLSQLDTAAYVMANFGSDSLFGDVRFSGNVGVRYVRSDIRSSGFLGAPTPQQLNITSAPFSVACVATVPPGSPPGTAASLPPVCRGGQAEYERLQRFATGETALNVAKNDYSYWLPSLNLKFGLSDEVIMRLAASKVLARPDNAYIRNFLTVGFDVNSGVLTGQSGNPYLKPATAWQFDASLEWYFARVGSLTFNAFYKAVENFFYQKQENIPIVTAQGVFSVSNLGPANFDGTGKIKGFEVAYQQTFDFLPGPFDGLGVNANYTYIKSKGLPNTFLNGGNLASTSTIAPSGNLPLEQLSKHNVNVAAFYEKGPISLRAAYNWRSRFLLTAADVIFPYYSVFNEPTGQLDASLFINLPRGIRVGVQGVNLLNEVTKTSQAYSGDPLLLAPRSYFVNDRRFSFIIRGNF